MNPEECRAQAAQLRKEAERTCNKAVQEQLLLIAANWDRLAAAADELAPF